MGSWVPTKANTTPDNTRRNSGWDQFWSGKTNESRTNSTGEQYHSTTNGRNKSERYTDRQGRTTSQTSTRESGGAAYGKTSKTTYRNEYAYSAKGGRYGSHRTTVKENGKEAVKVHYSYTDKDGKTATFSTPAARDAYARKH